MAVSEFIQVNLSDLIEQLGEDRTKTILSTFSCPLNKDVESFIKYKAIEFSRREFAKTHLVFWHSENEKELIGYYTIAQKFFEISKEGLSKRVAKRLSHHGKYDRNSRKYIISAPLIGQIGKNFTEGNDCLISGDELLKMALDKIKSVQREVGGRYTYLECEDKPKLIEFYEKNGFVEFGKRNLDKDEKDIEGQYLIQLMKYMN
jgi:hypothetical protein